MMVVQRKNSEGKFRENIGQTQYGKAIFKKSSPPSLLSKGLHDQGETNRRVLLAISENNAHAKNIGVDFERLTISQAPSI
jgi:hypothetical protein